MRMERLFGAVDIELPEPEAEVDGFPLLVIEHGGVYVKETAVAIGVLVHTILVNGLSIDEAASKYNITRQQINTAISYARLTRMFK